MPTFIRLTNRHNTHKRATKRQNLIVSFQSTGNFLSKNTKIAVEVENQGFMPPKFNHYRSSP